MPDAKGKKVLIAAGKTGGHMFPALALAENLRTSGCEVVLITGGAKIENLIFQGKSFRTIALRAPRLKGMRFWQKASGTMRLPWLLLHALAIVRKEAPTVIIGFGGADSGPVVLAGVLLRKRTAVCEQNAIFGLTNALLAPLVDRVFTSFENTKGGFGVRRVEVVGTPIRKEISTVKPKQYASCVNRILVTGGSQGASFLNANIPPVLALVAKDIESLEILHQTGTGCAREVQERYDALMLKARCVDFISNMASAYEWADFVIARAGASTIAEITAIGIPALLIPFAKAADNHQVQNASILVKAGAALMFEEKDFSTDKVASAIRDVLMDPVKLNTTANASRNLGKRDALEKLTARVLEMVG